MQCGDDFKAAGMLPTQLFCWIRLDGLQADGICPDRLSPRIEQAFLSYIFASQVWP